MKIMNVISALNFGGAETQVINLSKELAKQGHSVTIVSLSNDTPRLIELNDSKVNVIIENKQHKFDISLLKRLRKHITEFKPDIVHGYLFDAEFYCRLATIDINIPVINSERNDNYTFNRNQKIADILTSKLVNGVIANTYAGMEFAKLRYKHLGPLQHHVVWNGIDLKQINERLTACNTNYKIKLFNDSDIKLACMVASIKEQKDYELAIRVAEELISSDPKWRIIFLGDKVSISNDNYKNSINIQFQKVKDKDREKIKFLGNRKDVIEILHQSDISFLTSRHEGFPNAVLESMAVGTPIITTEFSDIRKIALYDWMVISSRSPSNFTSAINKAILERNMLSLKSIEWIENNCSIAVVVTKLIEIYSKYIPIKLEY